jgi:hypothetical protein
VADNLGWFRDSKTTIEDIMADKGEGVDKLGTDQAVLEFVEAAEQASRLEEPKLL